MSASTNGIVTVHATQTVTGTLDGLYCGNHGGGCYHWHRSPKRYWFSSGTGIANGSYLVSGSGTSTWTLNQATTAPGTITITCQVPCSNVKVHGNVIHMPSTSTSERAEHGEPC